MAESLENRVMLITGSTDGLGRAVAVELARRGASVLIHGRDEQRLETTLQLLQRETGVRARGYLADLSSLAEVRRFARELRDKEARLDVLINNVGIGRGPTGRQVREQSREGYELRFAVNYLAPFLLTHLLLPLLRASAPSRIVNVASIGQAPLDFDDLMLEREYDAGRAYARSKLALIMATFELASRLEGSAVTVNALHPGTLMPTKMVAEAWANTIDSLEQGVAAVVRLAVDPDLAAVSGQYYDGQRGARAHEQAYDASARRQLWDVSMNLVGVESGA